MRFSKTELQELAIAWLILGFCFSVRQFFRAPQGFPLAFAISLIGFGSGFLGHEMAHKLVAQRQGYFAEFRLWRQGLLLAALLAILTRGQFLFAAPGAVYVVGPPERGRQMGLVSAAGAIANLVLAAAFLPLASETGIVGRIGSSGFVINLWLAAFNMLPIPPLDGGKVMRWSFPAWLALAGVSWGSLGAVMFGLV